ncbi:alpha/beta hydrolase [Haladaptatus sp. DJG-WS-42]|uniref:alpha/beta hydrolase family protein n=1 Tax=Haladaptatus sp. DJG-WS-42 TaxID=3120516 RepID=UPI0030CE2A8E
MRVHFADKTFDYQTLRATAYAPYEGSALGECLATADRIEDGDFESWHTEWRRTADRVASEAERARDEGRDETARGAFFRAHTYYRTAEFFLAGDDARRIPTYERSRETFRAALDFLDTPVEAVEVPFEDTAISGYLFAPDDSEKPHPTLVCLGGFDSIAEELYFLCGVPAALERGYACFVFDGPGQGDLLRYESMRARTNWETVVGPVIDFLETEPVVDASKIALLGVSMGGFYAPRAAAFDDRVTACIAFDHCYDLWAASAYGQEAVASLFSYLPGALVNGVAALAARVDAGSRWQRQNAQWVFGTDMAGLLDTLKAYSLSDVAHRITCPTLALAGADDHLIPLPLAYEFVDAVAGPTTLRVFEEHEGAADHCQLGNLPLAHGVIYDWVADTLA